MTESIGMTNERPQLDERQDGSAIYPKQFEPRTLLDGAGLEILACICEATTRDNRLYRVQFICCDMVKTLSHAQIVQKNQQCRWRCRSCAAKASGASRTGKPRQQKKRQPAKSPEELRRAHSASVYPTWPVPESIFAEIHKS